MKPGTGHVQFCTSIPKELLKKLRSEAHERRVKQKEIAIAALSNFLSSTDKDERSILRRLALVTEQQRMLDDKLEILSETIALFIQVWFSNTFELPENEKAAASLQGEKRFKRFLEILGRRLNRDGASSTLDVTSAGKE